MECSPSSMPSTNLPRCCLIHRRHNFYKNGSLFGSKFACTTQSNLDVSCSCSPKVVSRSGGDVQKRSSLESLFCYDKSIPEEIIERLVGLSLAEKNIGNNPRCADCQVKGAVLCRTCSGSGLYVDSILESQGIIVKVRCLGCGGTGHVMCSECGGRGHH